MQWVAGFERATRQNLSGKLADLQLIIFSAGRVVLNVARANDSAMPAQNACGGAGWGKEPRNDRDTDAGPSGAGET